MGKKDLSKSCIYAQANILSVQFLI